MQNCPVEAIGDDGLWSKRLMQRRPLVEDKRGLFSDKRQAAEAIQECAQGLGRVEIG
jgi:hypothetical protein